MNTAQRATGAPTGGVSMDIKAARDLVRLWSNNDHDPEAEDYPAWCTIRAGLDALEREPALLAALGRLQAAVLAVLDCDECRPCLEDRRALMAALVPALDSKVVTEPAVKP